MYILKAKNTKSPEKKSIFGMQIEGISNIIPVFPEKKDCIDFLSSIGVKSENDLEKLGLEVCKIEGFSTEDEILQYNNDLCNIDNNNLVN